MRKFTRLSQEQWSGIVHIRIGDRRAQRIHNLIDLHIFGIHQQPQLFDAPTLFAVFHKSQSVLLHQSQISFTKSN